MKAAEALVVLLLASYFIFNVGVLIVLIVQLFNELTR